MKLFNKKLCAPIMASTAAIVWVKSKKDDTAMAEARILGCFFKSASTLNPKYDKRWKKGEDNLVVKEKFICALDGVGGWIDEGIDSGLMTKELVKHLEVNYDQKNFSNLHQLLDDSVKQVVAKGSTTAVMAKVYPSCASED